MIRIFPIQKDVVPKAIPEKQGLKPVSGSSSSNLILVPKAIPEKQGLKLCDVTGLPLPVVKSPKGHSRKTRIETGVTDRDTTLYAPCPKGHSRKTRIETASPKVTPISENWVPKAIPEKQGLKRQTNYSSFRGASVPKAIPEKQGLKLVTVEAPFMMIGWSQRPFQKNKD